MFSPRVLRPSICFSSLAWRHPGLRAANKNSVVRYINTKHNFDTYQTVSKLETNGKFPRNQAVAIMRCIRVLMRDSSAQVRSEMLAKSEMEKELYLFKATLSELRTEIKILRKNDHSILESEVSSISRDVEALSQKLREVVGSLKSDIHLEFNNRKAEVRQEQKKMEMKIHEFDNKYTLQLSDIRTDIEALKWETTRKGMMAAFGTATVILLAGILIKWTTKPAGATKEEPTSEFVPENAEISVS
ncbi:hypothetical protein K493DRAFT_293441 [Basidiobolus meristosporus CBS 931.73]|uniref:DUF1640-domain-containing protein n=1 Tax=Basidiobolus meristosporus CBS 931.73 TaxID=1314790 RepID=A0A1Y1X0T1_9FUNG|nr:hypothetical protein K493DRAFT_293441 [Basidiobolus meristosporus CBS 931.73]|eukprot:ORX78944.1 hypothetical protein K493DRAFT_293441 [Basidiobolus meristosporus CBS 931.73]